MPNELTLEKVPADQSPSHYTWININRKGIRIGKIRGLIYNKMLRICSINVFPEFEGQGFAKKTIDIFKESFTTIVADRVRYTARGFWEKMEFNDYNNGNYLWKNS